MAAAKFPFPWAVLSSGQKGARICKIGPQLALILRFKRLPKRLFFVEVASLKFLCEKKAQHSGESRKRKVPGLLPHKMSLARAQIEDFLVHYSRSTNLVSEQRCLSCWNGCHTRWNGLRTRKLTNKTDKKTSSALLWTPREEHCARTRGRNLSLIDKRCPRAACWPFSESRKL